MKFLLTLAIAALSLTWLTPTAHAETDRLRIGMQNGLPYMQLVLMRERGTVGIRARETGLANLRIEFVTVGGPAVLNDGLISGEIDIAAVGMSNLITMWDKTRGAGAVRGLSGMNVMPLLLVTSDPRIKTLADYVPADRIALPSVKVSMQAMMLNILAAKTFGENESRKLDGNTVSIGHPDATAGLIAGGGAFASHFSSLPYQYFELNHAGVHVVASSFDAIGPHSVSALSSTTKFRTDNPKTVAAFLSALHDTTMSIRDNPRDAAETYLRATHDKFTVDELLAMMSGPGMSFSLEPQGAGKTAAFMFKAGAIKHQPDSWRDLYFDTVPSNGS